MASSSYPTKWRDLSRVEQNVILKIMLGPSALCAAMIAVAAVTCTLAHVSVSGLFLAYFTVSLKATVTALLISIFCWLLAMARDGADAPVRTVMDRVQSRVALLLLPLIVLPVFLAAYTAAKTAIPFLVGFGWDGFWTEADSSLFGGDAWRIAQGWLGLRWMPVYAWIYTFGWGGAFLGVTALFAINAKPERVGVFYTAMLLTWILGGWLMALTFSSAGPVFIYLFDSALARHFAGVGEAIASGLPADNSLRLTQKYLAAGIQSHVALKGGGISAMPSMHLGAASIYVFASRKTRWLVPAVLFWLIIFVLSGYFGYHYWVDGIAAAAIAWVCWRVSELYLPPAGSGMSGGLDPITGPGEPRPK